MVSCNVHLSAHLAKGRSRLPVSGHVETEGTRSAALRPEGWRLTFAEHSASTSFLQQHVLTFLLLLREHPLPPKEKWCLNVWIPLHYRHLMLSLFFKKCFFLRAREAARVGKGRDGAEDVRQAPCGGGAQPNAPRGHGLSHEHPAAPKWRLCKRTRHSSQRVTADVPHPTGTCERAGAQWPGLPSWEDTVQALTSGWLLEADKSLENQGNKGKERVDKGDGGKCKCLFCF